MALLKQGQSLVETSQEELTKQTGFTPLSPAAAKAQGANPDQAKMAGSPAAKQAIYKAAPDTQQTLQQAQRQIEPKVGDLQKQAADQAAAKMDRIKQLGTMGTQLQGLIEKKIADLSTQQLGQQAQISQTAVNAIDETKRPAVQAALAAYAAAPTEAAKQQQLVALSQALGRPVNPGEINSFFQQMPELATAAAKQATAAPVTLGQLQPTWLNMPQTAADLGVSEAELASYTPEQLQAKLQEVEANEYNRTQNIKAQLATATGAQRQLLLRELGQEAQVGSTGTEAQFDRMQQAIDEGQTVRVGGQEMSLKDILTSDSISTLITNAINNPADLEKLRQSEPALAQWLDSNRTELENLAGTQRQDVRVFGAVQQAKTDITSKYGNLASLIIGELPEYATSADIEAATAKAQNSGLGQAVAEDASLMSYLQANPDIAGKLKNASKDDIIKLRSTMQLASENSDVADVFGLKPGEMPTDVALADKFTAAANAMKDIDDTTIRKDIAGLIASGDLTADFVSSMIATHPEEAQDVISEVKTTKAYDAVKNDFGKLTSFIFGEDTTQKSMNDTLSKLAAIAPYDADANRILNSFKSIVGADGYLDPSDMGRLQAAVKSAGLDGILGGKKTMAQSIEALSTQFKDLANFNPKDQGFLNAISTITADNNVSFEELTDVTKVSPEQLALLSSNGYFNAHYPDAVKAIKSIQAVRKTFPDGAPKGVMESMKDGKLDAAEIKKVGKGMDIEAMQKLLNSTLPFQKQTIKEPYKLLGKTYYRDVEVDAKADLQKMIDSKVDAELKSYPGISEGSTANINTVAVTKDLSKLGGGELSKKDGAAFITRLADSKSGLTAAVESINALLSEAPTYLQAPLKARRDKYNKAIAELNWWQSNLKANSFTGSYKVPQRSPYGG